MSYKTLLRKRFSAIYAIFFFIFWLIVLLAGADFPPPPGFLWLIIVVAACAFVVYWRVPTYIDWYHTKRPGRHWRVILEGIAAGIVVAFFFILRGIGDPSIRPQPVDYAIWFAIVSFMGVLNSLAIFFVNAVVLKILNRVKGSPS